jgi:hypothetical protein
MDTQEKAKPRRRRSSGVGVLNAFDAPSQAADSTRVGGLFPRWFETRMSVASQGVIREYVDGVESILV